MFEESTTTAAAQVKKAECRRGAEAQKHRGRRGGVQGARQVEGCPLARVIEAHQREDDLSPVTAKLAELAKEDRDAAEEKRKLPPMPRGAHPVPMVLANGAFMSKLDAAGEGCREA